MKGLSSFDFRHEYDGFDAPVTEVDCGRLCAAHNPSGKPFCCDICHAVPAVYRAEWAYLRRSTDLWRPWRGDECPQDADDPARLRAETPTNMVLLACKGPDACQRPFRALSCRQFPFVPYITADDRFIGLTVEWEFEAQCWVISHLEAVTETYRREFVRFYDGLFDRAPGEYEAYAAASEAMRAEFTRRRRRIPILHRRGGTYLLSPRDDRMARVQPQDLPRFGPYRNSTGEEA